MMKKLLLAFSAVAAVAFAVIVFILNSGKTVGTADELSFYVQTGNEIEEISCFEQDDGHVYAFFPSYAALENVTVHTNADICIGEHKVSDGDRCDGFELGKEYKLTINGADMGSLQFMKSANIATMYIDTRSGNMDKVYANKNNSVYVNVRVYDRSGKPEYTGNSFSDSFSGRGNTTWAHDKKPFKLKLQEPENLLGLGPMSSYNLISNAGDRTNLRNKIVFDFARDMGLPSPSCEFVDLYTNGDYAGTYLLTEPIVDCFANRNDYDVADILFRMEIEIRNTSFERFFKTNAGHFLNIDMPSDLSHSEMIELKENVQDMEDAFFENDTEKWINYIDIDSWIKMCLLDEVFFNVDIEHASQYYYKRSADGLIFAGPPWDYDLSMGIRGDEFKDPHRLNIIRKSNGWYTALCRNTVFYEKMVNEYSENWLPAIDKLLSTDIDAYADTIQSSVKLNDIRWEKSFRTGEKMYLYDEEYDSEENRIEYLKTFISEHIEYITGRFNDNSFLQTVSDTNANPEPAQGGLAKKSIKDIMKVLIKSSISIVTGFCFIVFLIVMIVIEIKRSGENKGVRR